MISCYILCLILNAFLLPTVLSQNDFTGMPEAKMQQVFDFSNIVKSIIEKYIQEALPPAAIPEGNRILQNTKEELTKCESTAKTTLNIEQYKICSSALLDNAMADLGALQPKYRPFTSSAQRIRFFM